MRVSIFYRLLIFGYTRLERLNKHAKMNRTVQLHISRHKIESNWAMFRFRLNDCSARSEIRTRRVLLPRVRIIDFRNIRKCVGCTFVNNYKSP